MMNEKFRFTMKMNEKVPIYEQKVEKL